MVDNRFGRLLKSRRLDATDPTTGRAYTRKRLAGLLEDELGESVSASLVAGWESESANEKNRIAVPKPKHVNALAKVLPNISVLEMVEAIGYEVERSGLRDDERELLAAFRRLQPSQRPGAVRLIRALPEPR